MKYYIGIDPGKKGGISVIKGSKIVYKRHMPTLGDDETAEMDIVKLAKILSRYRKRDCIVITEKFGGFFGYSKKTAVSINGQKEAILAACKILGIAYHCYMPTQWQSKIFSGTTVIKIKTGKNKGKKDTKAMALATIKRLFPHEKFIKETNKNKPFRGKSIHDGMIDATLLAELGKREGL